MSTLLLFMYVIFTSGGLVAIKLGTEPGRHTLKLAENVIIPFNPYIISGVILYGLSFLLYIYLISKFELGYIIPLTTALVYVLIFIASYIIFKEAFTALKIAGITLIVFGMILLNIKG